jgi:hypothetical protein
MIGTEGRFGTLHCCFLFNFFRPSPAGHSRRRTASVSLAYDPGVHHLTKTMDGQVKPGDDGGERSG